MTVHSGEARSILVPSSSISWFVDPHGLPGALRFGSLDFRDMNVSVTSSASMPEAPVYF